MQRVLLELAPDLFEAYVEFSSVPWKTGTLEPKVKEMIYIAFDAAATHLYVPGLKLHLRNAVTPLMKAVGYGQGYRYVHDDPDAKGHMTCLPESLAGRRYLGE